MSPKCLVQKLVKKNFQYQELRWNYSILHSVGQYILEGSLNNLIQRHTDNPAKHQRWTYNTILQLSQFLFLAEPLFFSAKTFVKLNIFKHTYNKWSFLRKYLAANHSILDAWQDSEYASVICWPDNIT